MSREGCGGKVLFLTHCSLTTGNELQLDTQFSWLQRRWFLMISQFVGCMFKLIRGLERIKLPWCSRCVTEKQEQTNKCFWGVSLCQVFARKLFPMTLTQVCDGHMTKREPIDDTLLYFAPKVVVLWCCCDLAAVMLLLLWVTCLLTSSSNNWTDDSTIT